MSGAIAVAGTATAIQVASSIGHKKDPIPRAIAGITLLVICVGIDSVTQSNLGTYFALLFLLATFLSSGVWLIDTMESVVNNA